MPEPQTLLAQVARLEQMCRAVGMVPSDTVLPFCAKLRETVAVIRCRFDPVHCGVCDTCVALKPMKGIE